MTIKPLGEYVCRYFKVGDKVEVLEIRTLSDIYSTTKVGDILEVVRDPSDGVAALLYPLGYLNGDRMVLRLVEEKTGLCGFLRDVRKRYDTN